MKITYIPNYTIILIDSFHLMFAFFSKFDGLVPL